MRHTRSVFFALLTFLLLGLSPATVVQAIPPTGTVNITGSLALSQDMIDFLPAGGETGKFRVVEESTGSFSRLVGKRGTIKDLDLGMTLPSLGFLIFGGSNIEFELVVIGPGSFSSAECFVPPAAGQTCTPPGTPYNFTNQITPFAGLFSTLSFVVGGNMVNTKSGESAPYVGIFTTQFAQPFQVVLATLGGGGTVISSYSATFAPAP